MRTDAELVASARSGDRDALAAIYDAYADRLYDLCSSVLRDPDAAFEAMLDTFVLAALELHRLRRPDKLEPWLFALARQQLLAREIPIGVDEHPEFGETVGASLGTDGAGAIVWEAASWLPGRDRILLDLCARQPLDHRAIAKALGVTPSHAAALERDLDERLERLMGSLLVARRGHPSCAGLQSLIASEDDDHPDVWLRHLALHVDVCRVCAASRAEQPGAIELIAGVPSEPAPPELRDEVLYRVDLLWSVLGPPDWTAPVVVSEDPVSELVETAEEPLAEGVSPAGDLSFDGDEPVDAGSADDDAAGYPEEYDDRDVEGEYDEYDETQEVDEVEEVEEVESLVPAPPRLRRSGFPRSIYRRRRRVVALATAVVVALIAAAVVTDFRGTGSGTNRVFAAETKAAAAAAPTTHQPAPSTTTATTATTAPPTTAPPTTAAGPDTRPPFVYNLATVYGCIGPSQTTTPALASVADDRGRLRSVELVFVDAGGGEVHRQMTRSGPDGAEYEGPIGPYTSDGTITWQVIGTDAAGNAASMVGPAVAASSTC